MNASVPVRVRRLPSHDPDLPLPAYATGGAAGLDISACLGTSDRDRGIELAPGARTLVPTGIAVEIPEGYELQIRPRSGLALRHGLALVNSPGTIDSDYRGEIGIILVNLGTEAVKITHGMRVAQAVLAPVIRLVWVEADALGESSRGEGGFGSTGTGR